ncbi:MAG: hypothetical protein GC146_07530 [Limimaricola sp.]|uniref:phage head spike fiber domain-containing protein n=1 Tax=Limimaricola sp. TaxID=2211665 RepID=UPI001D1BE0C1|nr:hypothetical protein [Limimaricola sp.]MBI1417055.1 hypothetical protein [Limimaricola sp.]
MSDPLLTPALIGGLGSAQQAVRNLLMDSEDVRSWGKVAASVSSPLHLNAMGRFSGYALATTGAAWGRANMLSRGVSLGESYVISTYVRPGSTGQFRHVIWYPAANLGDSIAGPISAPATGGNGFTLLGSIPQSDGQSVLIQYRYVATHTGMAEFGLSPNGTTSGDDLIVLAVQIEAGTVPTPYQRKPL